MERQQLFPVGTSTGICCGNRPRSNLAKPSGQQLQREANCRATKEQFWEKNVWRLPTSLPLAVGWLIKLIVD